MTNDRSRLIASVWMAAVIPFSMATSHAAEDDIPEIPDFSPYQHQFGIATTDKVTIKAPASEVWSALTNPAAWAEDVARVSTAHGAHGQPGEVIATFDADGRPARWIKVIRSDPAETWIGVSFEPSGENRATEFFQFDLAQVEGGTRVTRRSYRLVNCLTEMTMEQIIDKENAFYAFDGGSARYTRELERLKKASEEGPLPPSGNGEMTEFPSGSPNMRRFAIALEDSIIINRAPEEVWPVFLTPDWGELASHHITKYGLPGGRGEIRAYVEADGYPGDWSKVLVTIPNKRRVSTWFHPHEHIQGFDGGAVTDFELEAVPEGTRVTRRSYISLPVTAVGDWADLTMDEIAEKESWYYGMDGGPARFRRDLQRLKEMCEDG